MDGASGFRNSTQLSKLIDETSTLMRELDRCGHRPAVASLLRLALPHVNFLHDDDIPTNEHGYSRQMIYTDPDGHFSILAIRWTPGARTPIHGHNAWGCVGVLEGEIGCETFALKADHSGPCVAQAPDLVSTGKILAGPGTVASVDPDPCGIHSIFNPTSAAATTLHIYGMDLVERPEGLNKWYQHQH